MTDPHPEENGDLHKLCRRIESKVDSIAGNLTLANAIAGLNDINEKDDVIDLLALWQALWRDKWIIIFVTLLFTSLAVLYSLSLPNVYRSEVLLAPAEESSGGGLSALAGQFGGLANLAGVNLQSNSINKTDLALEVLRSRKFISHLIQKYDLLLPLMASKGWDRAAGELTVNPKKYDVENKKWLRENGQLQKSEPSAQESYEAFRKIMGVSPDKKTNFVSLSVEFYSPVFAKEWVDLIVRELNSVTKEREVKEAERSIEYLKKQIEKTPVAEMQAVFYELIEEQTKVIMFAEVRDEYVFKTIDEAVIPEQKSRPRRAVICLLGAVVGGAFALIVVFLRHGISRHKLRQIADRIPDAI